LEEAVDVVGQKTPFARADAVALIARTLAEFRPIVTGDLEAAAIYGDGQMDSMTLVVFIAELEARLGEATHRDLSLASERAMSRRQSPYRDAGALADFVLELLEDHRG
jgi:hypothetical protein